MEEQALSEVAAESTFSLIGLLGEADLVVKLVLLVLLIASIWSWAVVAEKTFTIGGARKKAKAFEDAFWGGRADEFEMRPGQAPDNAGAKLFTSISREWRDAKSISLAEHGALVARAERSLRATVDREIARVGNGLGVLATIGSVSAFIGLFGTVWGIMNAFLNIEAKQDPSLAVVAGPIAEALFATGMGLVAAIPAVIFYNKFSGDLNRYADTLDAFCQDVLVRLSRRASEGKA
ncbi:MAG: protein TolQ [Alphaproteobacteria bacterium]|jgi:biopolymer transport protein TolQ|nr:protein TolQ [Alphaproteobacteria bacterium]